MSRFTSSRGRIEAMERRRPVVRSRNLVVSLGLTAAVASGCTSSKSTEAAPTAVETPSTTTVPLSTTTTVDPIEMSVIEGYRAFWSAFLKAADPMNPQHPDLLATATGEQLEQVQKAFLARLSGGEVIRGTLDLRPRLSGPVQGTTATISDCYADDTHLFAADSGAQKDEPGVVNQQVRAEMVLQSGVWKVTAVRHEGEGCTPA